MIHDYTHFGWSSLAVPSSEAYGLDYESAREATRRWFAVLAGDGNDGVSHIFPDYYIRTADPWRVAELAMLHCFLPQHRDSVRQNMSIDGEADYTITAELLDPPNNSDGDYSDANGAYLLIDVFPADDDFSPDRSSAPCYDSIDDCFATSEGA